MGDLIPFPGSAVADEPDDGPQPTEYETFTVSEPQVEEEPVRIGPAEARQLRATQALVDLLNENAGDIAIFGDTFRRFEVEHLTGSDITEDEFVFISHWVNSYITKTTWVALHLVIEDARRTWTKLKEANV